MSAFLQRLTQRVQARLASEDGFTMIELLNVLLILGILMSISISAYSTLKSRAEEKSARANVAAILPAINSWRVDHGTYAGMTMPLLNAEYLDGSLDITYFDVGPGALDATNYCVSYTVPTGDFTAIAVGPSGTVSVGPTLAC